MAEVRFPESLELDWNQVTVFFRIWCINLSHKHHFSLPATLELHFKMAALKDRGF